MTRTFNQALDQRRRDQQASEGRILGQMESNTARMEQRLHNMVKAGDQRAQEDRQQMLRDMDEKQQVMEDRISRLIRNVAMSGRQTLGDVEQLMERQREIDAASQKQERSVRLIDRFTAMETTLQAQSAIHMSAVA